MLDTHKIFKQKHMLPMADFAELILEQYERKLRQLEQEIKSLSKQISK